MTTLAKPGRRPEAGGRRPERNAIVVEQDMYPCDFSKPKPIAERTFGYLNANGLGGTA